MANVRPLWHPSQGTPPPGRLRARLGRVASRITVPAALCRLAEMPLTVIGAGCIDAGVYTQSLTAGLIVTGLSLIGLEYLIADED